MIKIFGIYVYISKYRLKRRDKLDKLRSNKRGQLNRAKNEYTRKRVAYAHAVVRLSPLMN